MTGDSDLDRDRPREPLPAEVDDLLRPTVCPRCEYRLAGLPAAGICPECGRAYGLPEVVLYGYTRGDRASLRARLNGLMGPGFLCCGAVLAIVIAARPRRFPDDGFTFFEFVVLPPLAALNAIVAVVRYLRDRGTAAVQVCLSPAGLATAARQPGPVPFAGSSAAFVVPWPQYKRVRLTTGPGGRLRIRASSVTPWWKYSKTFVVPIDKTVSCSSDAADAIVERVRQWTPNCD